MFLSFEVASYLIYPNMNTPYAFQIKCYTVVPISCLFLLLVVFPPFLNRDQSSSKSAKRCGSHFR